MKTRRCVCFVLALCALLLAATCLEPPVKERIDVRILPGNRTVLTVSTDLAVPETSDRGPQLERRVRERVDEARQALLHDRDEWTARFERCEPVMDRRVWEKEGGQLRRVERSALLESPEALKRFFSDTLVLVAFRETEEWSEITLRPAGGGRASAPQRRQVEETFAGWSASVSDYLRAVRELYLYLDGHPERAEACLSKVFADLQSLDLGKEEETTSEEEDRLIAALVEAMNGVLAIFSVPEDSSYSIEELSHLVYDSFPAPLTLRIDGEILEIEGFETVKDEPRLRIPPLSLFGALQGLEGRWVSPDPLLYYHTQAILAPEEPIDIRPFLEAPRRSAAPVSAEEVRRAIEARLVPPPFYRVRWRGRTQAAAPRFDWKRFDLDQ